jgi:hypothetical protein
MKNISKTKNIVIAAGLMTILILPIVGAESAFAGKAAYTAGQATQNITQLQGDIYVYPYRLGDVGEHQNSLIFASQNHIDYTVGVGIYAIGQGTWPDKVYKFSYLDQGSTYNNVHYFGSELNSGWVSVELKKSGSNWLTYHGGSLHKTIACPSTGCPSNFKLFGTATNTNAALGDIVFRGDFQNLKGTTNGGLTDWSGLVNYNKCHASSGAYASHGNYNTQAHYESSPGGSASCGTVDWGWFYNNMQGSWGT